MTSVYQGLAYLMPPKHMDGMSMAGVWRGKYEQTRDQFIIEKHASIISRGSVGSAVAKFDKDKQIREFCSHLDEPLGSCSAEKEYKCSQNEETGKWKVQTCKLPGFIHPGTGQCNCDEEWVNKIKPVGGQITSIKTSLQIIIPKKFFEIFFSE